MSLPGGASDKIGNRYEGRLAVYCMIEVLTGKAESIRFEPPGIEGKGIEFWLRKNGIRYYYQAKRQNSKSGRWNLKDLYAENVLLNAREKLQDDSAVFVFASSHSPFEITSLSDKARDSQSLDEFKKEFIKAKANTNAFNELQNYWSGDSEEDVYKILKRIHPKTIDENSLREQNEQNLESIIDENSANAADVLAQLALDKVHQELNARDIWGHLESRDFHKKSISSNPQKSYTNITLSDGMAQLLENQRLGFENMEKLIKDSQSNDTEMNSKKSVMPNSWEDWLNKASKYYHSYDYKNALIAINKASELAPTDFNVINSKGCIFAEYAIEYNGPKSMLYEAITIFESLKEDESYLSSVDYNIGNCYSELEEHQKAIEHYDKAISAKPNTKLMAQIYNNRGRSYHYLGDQKKEKASYRKALKLNPTLFQTYACWGGTELENHNYQKARDMLLKAFQVDPEKEIIAYGPLYSLAYSLWKLGQYIDAYIRIKQYLILKPSSKNGQYLKATLLALLWKKDTKYLSDAIEFFENFLIDNPEDQAARSELYIIYHSSEYHHNPKEILIKTVQSGVIRVQALFYYANLLDQDGKTEEAIKYLEIAFNKSQEHHIVHRLADYKYKMEDYRGAINFYKLAINENEAMTIIHRIANCYYFLDEYRKCVRILVFAILINPCKVDIWNNLGYALKKLKIDGIFFISSYAIKKLQDDSNISSVEMQGAIDELLSRLKVKFGKDFVDEIEKMSTAKDYSSI